MKFWLTLIYIAISCIILGLIDAVWTLGYAPKSAIKIVFFGLIPLVLMWKFYKNEFLGMFKFSKRSLKKTILLGLIIYGVIVGGYFAINPFVNLSNITSSLGKSVGVNATNFIFVALHISIVNSLLEEFFFRGFGVVFLGINNKWRTYIMLSILFALYHVAMMIGWYDWWIFILAISGLFITGIVFHLLNEKERTLYNSSKSRLDTRDFSRVRKDGTFFVFLGIDW